MSIQRMIAATEPTITFEFKKYHLVAYASSTELRIDVFRDATMHYDKIKSFKESGIAAKQCEDAAAQAWRIWRNGPDYQRSPGDRWLEVFTNQEPPKESEVCGGSGEEQDRVNKPR